MAAPALLGLLGLLAGPAAQAEGEVVTEVGEATALPFNGNWPRIFPGAGDGGWVLLFSRGHRYVRVPLSAAFEPQDAERRLNETDDLVDHAVATCPDGTWLHIASANLDQLDDSAYAFRYSASFDLLAEGVITERDTHYRTNDAPVLCTESISGTMLPPRDEDDEDGLFVTLDATATPSGSVVVPTVPMIPGSSLIYEPETDTVLNVRSNPFTPKLTLQRYTHDLAFEDWTNVQVLPDTHRALWPQATIRVGDLYLVAHIGRDVTVGFGSDTGDVWVQVFDIDLNHLQAVRLTELAADDGAQRPWLAHQDGTVVVVFDKNNVPWRVSLQLDPSVVGGGDTGALGDTGDTGQPGSDTDTPADSGTPAPEDSGEAGDTAAAADSGTTRAASATPCGCSGGGGAVMLVGALALARRRRPRPLSG